MARTLQSGRLTERVAFDSPQMVPDGRGGQDRTWAEVHECRAEFAYDRGAERVQSGGLTGTAVFKVRVRANSATRELTAQDRMRDVRRSVAFNIREVDVYTDRASVWLTVEQGVAV